MPLLGYLAVWYPKPPHPTAISMAFTNEVTQLLLAHRRGDRDVADRLFELIYDELHNMAHRQLQRRRPGETLNTTALVHEAYLKMIDHSKGDFEDRTHFLAVSATIMRHILVDYARKQKTGKRGGEVHRTLLNASMVGNQDASVDILELNDALDRLKDINERLAKVVEMRFFGGLSHEEISQALGTSLRTTERDWHKAKTFLYLILA